LARGVSEYMLFSIEVPTAELAKAVMRRRERARAKRGEECDSGGKRQTLGRPRLGFRNRRRQHR
jgi:hypothetical protein